MIEDRVFSVYIHKFPNGKQYVGITSVKPETRWANGNGYKKNKVMYEDIKKYGWNNIEHILFNDEDILYDEEEACYIEKCLIDSWDLTNPEKGYNLRTGGTSSYTQHKNTRKKISESVKKNKKLKKISEENCKSILQFDLDGNFLSEFRSIREAETKLNINHSNISACCLRKRIKAGNFIWRYKFDNFEKIKPQLPYGNKSINQYDFNMNKIAEFSSIAEAERKLKINHSHICNCCSGKRKTAGGYIWKYKE